MLSCPCLTRSHPFPAIRKRQKGESSQPRGAHTVRVPPGTLGQRAPHGHPDRKQERPGRWKRRRIHTPTDGRNQGNHGTEGRGGRV